MCWSRRTNGQNQPSVAGLRKHPNAPFDLGGVAEIDSDHVQTERRCDGLNHSELPDTVDDGLAHYSHPRRVRRDFLEEFRPLRGQIVLETQKAGGIAARSR